MDARAHYSSVAITLHWLIAALIIANVFVGGAMEDAKGAAKAQIFVYHMSVGISVLLLSLVRLGWRLREPWPALPAGMAQWERLLARLTHVGFYVLMIGVPLLGWATVSANPRVSGLEWWGVIPWPELPLAKSDDLAETLGDTHEASVKLVYVLLALHVAGALKHHFLSKDDVLARMIPLLRRRA